MDTILLPASSVFSISMPQGDENNGLPFFTSQIVIQGNSSTIRRDPGAPTAFRVLEVLAGGILTLQQTTISGGGGNDFPSGGGLSNSGGTVTLINSTVSGNSAYGGGGLSNSGTVTLINSTVSGNSADYGGGLSNSGTATLTNSTVSGNSASIHGGLRNYGTVALISSTVSGNSAYRGGGLGSYSGAVTLTRSTVSGNSATYGGGLTAFHSTITLTHSTVSGNSAGRMGGGLYAYLGTFTLTHCTVSGNSAGNSAGNGGGGLYTRFSGVTLSNSTVSGNSAGDQGGGLFSSNDTVTLTHSTVSGNTSGGASEMYEVNSTLTLNRNLFGHSGRSNGSAFYGFTPGPTDINATSDGPGGGTALTAILNPTLANNGGPTRTHALVFGSPAVDAIAYADCTLPSDQRGIARPQGTGCDIGAFEARQGNLRAVKTASNAVIGIDGTTTFTLSARNLALTPDVGGSLSDTIPSNLSITSVTPTTTGTVCETVGKLVSCTLPSLALNDVASVDIATTGDAVGDASNTVTVKTGADIDIDPTDDSSTAAVMVASVTVAPTTDTKLTLNQHCVVATMTDSIGTLLPGIPFAFAVTGVNPATGTVSTGASGTAQFCFNGPNGGTDNISASYLGVFGTASVSWTKRDTTLKADAVPAVIVTQGLQILIRLRPKATLMDSTGNTPIAGRSVTFKAGNNSTLCTATTNASGVATCQATVPNTLRTVLGLGYTASFSGDTSYKPSTTNGDFLGLSLF
ncbi:MAG: choice-of-anchor Q domain-containing protein [Panacagrimonas sp.]